MKKLNLESGRVTFHRDEDGTVNLQIPDVIANGKLPDDAIFELEAHTEYIIKKYGLK